MDLDKYYDKRADGSYIIHFPNNKGFSMSEIEKMFSEYGEVLSVDNRGQAYGLCFVKYKSLEDTKRCIEGFQSHKLINILPHKNKAKGITTKKKSYNDCKKAPQKNYSKDDSKDSFGGKNQYDSHLRNNEYDTQSDSNVPKSLSTKDINSMNNDTIDSDNFSDTSLTSLRNVNANNRSIKTRPFLKDLIQLKKSQIAASSTSLSSGATNENSKGMEEIGDTKIPALVAIDQEYGVRNNKFVSTYLAIIPAHEVIVANIHPSLSIYYILHLFEKYNPISISLMKITPVRGIRYCHVYYKTPEEAFATIKEFDTYCLHGRNLIVLTSQKLIQEAY